jgi:hypothetical protein
MWPLSIGSVVKVKTIFIPMEDLIKYGYKKKMNYNPYLFWLLTKKKNLIYENFEPFFSHFYID